MNEWLKRYAAAHEQGANSLWRIDLMAGDRKEIDAELVHVGRNLADGLRRIGVKQDAMLDPRRDNVITLLAKLEEHALEREVVGLAAATGKDNLVNVAAKQGRNVAARRLKRGFCSNRSPMSARGIAELRAKTRHHSVCNRDRPNLTMSPETP